MVQYIPIYNSQGVQIGNLGMGIYKITARKEDRVRIAPGWVDPMTLKKISDKECK